MRGTRTTNWMRRSGAALISLALACSLVPAPALADALDAADTTAADEQLVAQDDAAQALPELTTGVPLDVNMPGEGEHIWRCRFVAPETAAYRFYSTGDHHTMGSLYGDEACKEWINSGNEQGADDANFSFVSSLEQGQVTYLEVTSDDEGAIVCQVHVDNIQGSTNKLEYSSVFVDTPIFLQGAGVAFPEVHVFDALDNELLEGTDYTLAYYRRSVDEGGTPSYTPVAELDEPGDYYVQATATEGGAYTGASPHELVPVSSDYDLSVAEIEPEQTSLPIVNGAAQIPSVRVTINGFEVAEGNYKVVVYREAREDEERGDPLDQITEPGNYELTIDEVEGSDYFLPAGSTATFNSIDAYDPNDLSVAYVSPDGYLYYDFEDANIRYYYLLKDTPIEPSLHVSMPPATSGGEERELVRDTDYTVAFANNDRPSVAGDSAVATLTGLGDYAGTTTSLEFYLLEHIDLSTFLPSVGCDLDTGQSYINYAGKYQFDPVVLYTEGAALKPIVDFENRVFSDEYPQQGTDFEVSYLNADGNAVDELAAGGTYTIVLTAKAGGMCTGETSFPVEVRAAANLKDATVTLSRTSYTYTGFEKKPTVTSVVLDGVTLEENADYYVTYSNNKNAGTAKVVIHGLLDNGYCGTAKKTFKIKKVTQPMKAVGRIVRVQASKLAKKAQTIKRTKATRILFAKGKLSYKKATTAKKFKKWKVNKNTGTITVPKGTKKGIYRFKVKITAKGTTNYKSGSNTATVRVLVL